MWPKNQFNTGLKDFHGRNRSTLTHAAQRIFDNTGKSFSPALALSTRQRVATIPAKEKMDTEQIPEGHYQATIAACASGSSDLIVVAQDTTYYNMTSHAGRAGLGPL